MSLEDVPKDSMCDYLLEPVEAEEEEEEDKEKTTNNEKEGDGAKAVKKVSERSNLVIFAVDISGSMNATTAVPDLQGQSELISCPIIIGPIPIIMYHYGYS